MQTATINKLDRVFSEFIRLRDASANGYVRCISCGKIGHWKDVDCGHYVNRKHLSTRWHEKNCNAQCRACNRFDEGNMLGYTKGLVKKYGPSVLDELDMLKHQTSKLSDFEGKLLIKHYQDKLKELKKQKAA
jgi:hypothetical protein